METEEKVRELQDIAAEQLAEQNVMGLMLTALMATHPNRAALLAAFDIAVANYESQSGDQGFDLGHPPHILRDLLERMRPRIERFRKWLQPSS